MNLQTKMKALEKEYKKKQPFKVNIFRLPKDRKAYDTHIEKDNEFNIAIVAKETRVKG